MQRTKLSFFSTCVVSCTRRRILKKRTTTLQRPIDAKMHIQGDARTGFQKEEDYRPIEICTQILFRHFVPFENAKRTCSSV